MSKVDPFTLRRLTKFVCEFRENHAVLPTLKDLSDGGFEKDVVDYAIKNKLILELYVTLTNGSIVKGYKTFFE